MDELRVESTRSGLVESVHPVSVAVVDDQGRLLAHSGEPHRVTYWRSAAKPFQALPLLQDGAWSHFGFGAQELALACASHSSELIHRQLCSQMLSRLSLNEEQLACGPHPVSMPSLAEEVARQGTALTPVWSNCSGKHTGMLALCLHRGWSLDGYQRKEHPLQRRLLDEVCSWTDVKRQDVHLGVDGCTVVCFGLPLSAMARAYARLGASTDASAKQIREAMLAFPELVAGTGRLCTELMQLAQGSVLAKVGAEGIYCASLPERGWGVAVKVESGDNRGNRVALLEVLRQLEVDLPWNRLAHHAQLELRNTRDEVVGALSPAGRLRR